MGPNPLWFAEALWFAEGYFDAIVSVDSYHRHPRRPRSDGWKHWQRWEAQGTRTAPPSWREQCAHQADDLARDAGRTYGFPRLLAHRTIT